MQKQERTDRAALQDVFLSAVKSSRTPLTVFLVSGFQMHGELSAFDKYTIVLISDGKQQLIYKHAISTLVPQREVSFSQHT